MIMCRFSNSNCALLFHVDGVDGGATGGELDGEYVWKVVPQSSSVMFDHLVQ